MENAFAWLGKLIEWIGAFIPRWEIIDTTQGAVKFVGGKKIKVVGPGIPWYWPARTKLVVYPTARQSILLKSQTFETTDGKTMAAVVLLVFKVDDLEPLIAHTFDPDGTIAEIGLGTSHDVLCQMSSQELRDDKPLHLALKQSAQRGLRPFGVKVLSASLVNLAPALVINLIHSGTEPKQVTEIE